MSENLKPCPFCGSSNVRHSRPAYVICEDCRATGPIRNCIAGWNAAPRPDAPGTVKFAPGVVEGKLIEDLAGEMFVAKIGDVLLMSSGRTIDVADFVGRSARATGLLSDQPIDGQRVMIVQRVEAVAEAAKAFWPRWEKSRQKVSIWNFYTNEPIYGYHNSSENRVGYAAIDGRWGTGLCIEIYKAADLPSAKAAVIAHLKAKGKLAQDWIEPAEGEWKIKAAGALLQFTARGEEFAAFSDAVIDVEKRVWWVDSKWSSEHTKAQTEHPYTDLESAKQEARIAVARAMEAKKAAVPAPKPETPADVVEVGEWERGSTTRLYLKGTKLGAVWEDGKGGAYWCVGSVNGTAAPDFPSAQLALLMHLHETGAFYPKEQAGKVEWREQTPNFRALFADGKYIATAGEYDWCGDLNGLGGGTAQGISTNQLALFTTALRRGLLRKADHSGDANKMASAPAPEPHTDGPDRTLEERVADAERRLAKLEAR